MSLLLPFSGDCLVHTKSTGTGALEALLASPSLRLLTPGERHAGLLLEIVRHNEATGHLVFETLSSPSASSMVCASC